MAIIILKNGRGNDRNMDRVLTLPGIVRKGISKDP